MSVERIEGFRDRLRWCVAVVRNSWNQRRFVSFLAPFITQHSDELSAGYEYHQQVYTRNRCDQVDALWEQCISLWSQWSWFREQMVTPSPEPSTPRVRETVVPVRRR
jgi:hypothetical protein